MSIMDRLLNQDSVNQNSNQEDTTTRRVSGRITLIDEAGWGFISSKEIPFRRIFFHWSALEQKTLKFQELEEGMIVEFKPIFIGKTETSEEKGWRAIRIVVTDTREDRE